MQTYDQHHEDHRNNPPFYSGGFADPALLRRGFALYGVQRLAASPGTARALSDNPHV